MSQTSSIDWDTASQGGTGDVSPFSTAVLVLCRSLSRPAERAQASRDASFISRRPILRELFNAIAENPFNSDILTVFDPTLDQLLPSVLVIALLLILSCRRIQLRRIDPPILARAKTYDGFRPELIAIPAKVLDSDGSTPGRPETPWPPVSSFR